MGQPKKRSSTHKAFHSYKSAGVDIDKADQFVNAISPLTKSTARKGADGVIGGFGALFDLKAEGFNDPILVSSTDGVGTKLKIAIALGKHDTIGIDLVAMCVNDVLVHGARPLFFLDYFATGKLDVEVGRSIIVGIVEGCRQAGCALIGGETAQMKGLYRPGDYDLAGFVVGAVERNAQLPLPELNIGSVILGLQSSGLHSNGFSLVRQLIRSWDVDLRAPCPFQRSKYENIGQALLEPTRIYAKSVAAALQVGGVKAMAHITGGGLVENLPRVMPRGCKAVIKQGSWEKPDVYNWMISKGLSLKRQDVLRVFNFGIGMALVVDQSAKSAVTRQLEKSGERVFEIGRIESCDGEPFVEVVG